jgi:hypothetical protein
MLFELFYVVANRVVEYGDYLSPEVFDDTLVLVDRYVELHDVRQADFLPRLLIDAE